MRAWILAALLALVSLGGTAGADPKHRILPGVIDNDDRTMLDSDAWPWVAVGRLNTPTGFCTGTLIAADQVLTAAHCLVDRKQHRQIDASRVHFLAGYRRGGFVAHGVGASVLASGAFDPEAEMSQLREGEDWLVLRLAEPLRVPPILLAPVGRAADPTKASILLVGYAQDRPHLLSIHRDCHIVGLKGEQNLLGHTCDATRGASGAPLLYQEGREVVIVGLNVAAAKTPVGDVNLGVSTDGIRAALAKVAVTASPKPR